MALTTSKLTEFPLRSTIPLSSHSPAWFFCFGSPSRRPSLSLLFKPLSSLRSTTTTNRKLNPSKNPNPDTVNSKPPSAPWLAKWPSPKSHPESSKRPTVSKRDNRNFDGRSSSGSGTSAMERIVLRLRNLGLGSDDEEGEEEEEEEDENSPMQVTGEEKLGDLLRRDWVRPDKVLEEENDEDDTVLPWERIEVEAEEMIQGKEVKKRTVKAPTLAELTMEDSELRRLRRLGMTIRERISVAKAGVTGAILEKIHETWRRSELVRLKFHESLAHDMKTAHELVERRSGGLVIWRAGSVMVVYRGSNYEGPRIKPQATDRDNFVPDVSSSDILIAKNDNGSTSTLEKSKHAFSPRVESMTEEEAEYNSLLDGLGPRFEDWWGTGVLPVDADLLPQTIPGFKTPLRLLPTGMRSRLTNAELTSLRKLAKSLPCHFALGRNRNHQGLAAAIVKLWEKSLVVKIAVKRGIQNTNNKLMAEEIKNLTGGLLLLRNKYFIIIYRGKDFIPTSVAAALAERQEITKQIQDVEEKVRRGPTEAQIVTEDGGARAGTLAEFYEAQAQWGREISSEEREKMIEEASRAKTAKVVRRLEHKLAIAQARKGKAEKLLRKIVASWVPVGPSDDQETITDEERVMYRRVGLRMKAYLPLGIRGVFDGVIENMHLHWKHRELVKLISKEKELAFVEETARLLEYESGGILVAIERVSKGFTLIYYRGKNYRRPISLRPRNLLTKAKALKRRVALQRYEALSQHISELEQTVEQMKKEIGDSKGMDGRDTCNLVGDGTLNHHSDSTEIEDEASWMDSDDDDDGEDFDYEDSNASESSMFEDDDFASNIKV